MVHGTDFLYHSEEGGALFAHHLFNLHNSYPFLLQDLTGSTLVRYTIFLSQTVGFTTFCIVIAALTLMYNHLVLSRRADMNYAGYNCA